MAAIGDGVYEGDVTYDSARSNAISTTLTPHWSHEEQKYLCVGLECPVHRSQHIPSRVQVNSGTARLPNVSYEVHPASRCEKATDMGDYFEYSSLPRSWCSSHEAVFHWLTWACGWIAVVYPMSPADLKFLISKHCLIARLYCGADWN